MTILWWFLAAIGVGVASAYIRARLAQARLEMEKQEATARAHRWGR